MKAWRVARLYPEKFHSQRRCLKPVEISYADEVMRGDTGYIIPTLWARISLRRPYSFAGPLALCRGCAQAIGAERDNNTDLSYDHSKATATACAR